MRSLYVFTRMSITHFDLTSVLRLPVCVFLSNQSIILSILETILIIEHIPITEHLTVYTTMVSHS